MRRACSRPVNTKVTISVSIPATMKTSLGRIIFRPTENGSTRPSATLRSSTPTIPIFRNRRSRFITAKRMSGLQEKTLSRIFSTFSSKMSTIHWLRRKVSILRITAWSTLPFGRSTSGTIPSRLKLTAQQSISIWKAGNAFAATRSISAPTRPVRPKRDPV